MMISTGRKPGVSDHEVTRIRDVYAEREKRRSGTLAADASNPGNIRNRAELRGRLIQVLRERLPKRLPECRVLDVGCGYGGLLRWLNEEGVPAANDRAPGGGVGARGGSRSPAWSGRFCQAATAGSLTKGSSLKGAMVSSVM